MTVQSAEYAPWLARWGLVPDGAPITTHASRLLPVRRGEEPAMLKLPDAPDERRGYLPLEYWNGDGAARLLARSEHGEAMLIERATGHRSLAAMARSGDKGDDENIGVIARRPEFLPLLRAQLTPERVKTWFVHLVRGEVERFEVPGLHALNLVLHQALAGGGVASLRSDPLGKSFAQMLLDLPVRVPRRWADDGLLAPHHFPSL